MPILQSWPKEISSKCRDVELKPLSKGNSRQLPGGGAEMRKHINIYYKHILFNTGLFYFVFLSFNICSTYSEKFYFQLGIAINYLKGFKYTLKNTF